MLFFIHLFIKELFLVFITYLVEMFNFRLSKIVFDNQCITLYRCNKGIIFFTLEKVQYTISILEIYLYRGVVDSSIKLFYNIYYT